MENHPKRKRRWSAEEREQIVVAYRASGKTQKSFCLEAGISVASLTNWLRVGRKLPDGGELIEVSLPPIGSGGVEVVLAGMTFRIAPGTPSVWASELLHAVRCGA